MCSALDSRLKVWKGFSLQGWLVSSVKTDWYGRAQPVLYIERQCHYFQLFIFSIASRKEQMEDFFVSWYENCTIWLNFLFDVSVNLVRKKIGKLMVGRKEIRHSFGLDWYNGRKFYCWRYRLCQKKGPILIRVGLNLLLVLLLLLLLVFLLAKKEKEKRISTSVSKCRSIFFVQFKSAGKLFVPWPASTACFIKDISKAIVLSQENVRLWEKQAALCPFCKQPAFRSFFINKPRLFVAILGF